MAFQGGVFNWTGGALSVGVHYGNLTNASATLASGSVTGSTTIAGNYTQLTTAKLAIDLGGTAAGATYDSIGVNDSDGADFLAWQRQLGSGVSAGAVAAAVPEPGAASLAVVVALGLAAQSKRFRRLGR